jgi:hypothetical protein
MREKINLGQWTEDSLNELLDEASSISQPGERIAFLSEKFLGTAYLESTLIGSKDTSEVFVINLEQVDCLKVLFRFQRKPKEGEIPFRITVICKSKSLFY